jgi:CRISPR/Cas system-associated protein endoribonuclease Cas2
MESESKVMVVIKMFQLPTASLALKKQARVCLLIGEYEPYST